jgi:transketolase
MQIPSLNQPLDSEQLEFLSVFSKSCRSSIVDMVSRPQSGHPGGSLSSVDYLSLIYTMRVCQTNEPVIVSHGHISPAVYSVLAELGLFEKQRVIENFRRPTDIFEGHVYRKVPGVHFGTGPLGVGGSVASGIALAEKIKKSPEDELVFLLMGDGEQQEGQVYEMINFASKFKLNNLVLFIDYNEVQLTDSLEEIMPLDLVAIYKAAGWQVQEVDGHDFSALWEAIGKAAEDKDRPCMILGKTVMGRGVDYMENTGLNKKSDWHGKAPKPDQTEVALDQLVLTAQETAVLEAGLAALPKNIHTTSSPKEELKIPVNPGEAKNYGPEVFTDCRSAYGDALLDLATLNPHVLAMTADLSESVKTNGVKEHFPDRHIECGIAEQHMVSSAAGLGLRGFVPFCSTFGAFMTSRAKDQARVNDINETNVKMVATHCGLSVGEDGPTHQAIDDIASFSSFFHTGILEPADPNQCDRIIRAIAKEAGNFYVRMGRAKIPVITREDGSPFFGGDYEFKLGKADLLRTGGKVTLIASGPMVIHTLKAAEAFGGDVDVIAVSSFLPFDSETVIKSVQKTGAVVTVHDHQVETGLAHFVRMALEKASLSVPTRHLGVRGYQLSGTADELYELAGLSVPHVLAALGEVVDLKG